jgi:hypothetical protein
MTPHAAGGQQLDWDTKFSSLQADTLRLTLQFDTSTPGMQVNDHANPAGDDRPRAITLYALAVGV